MVKKPKGWCHKWAVTQLHFAYKKKLSLYAFKQLFISQLYFSAAFIKLDYYYDYKVTALQKLLQSSCLNSALLHPASPCDWWEDQMRRCKWFSWCRKEENNPRSSHVWKCPGTFSATSSEVTATKNTAMQTIFPNFSQLIFGMCQWDSQGVAKSECLCFEFKHQFHPACIT